MLERSFRAPRRGRRRPAGRGDRGRRAAIRVAVGALRAAAELVRPMERHAVSEPEIVVVADAGRPARSRPPSGSPRPCADAVDERGRADWATTGGSTPVGIYRRLAGPPLRDDVPWPTVHVWWGDDRFVPRDHPLSNVKPFDDILLDVATAEDGHARARGTSGRARSRSTNVHPFPTSEAIGAARGAALVRRGSSPTSCARPDLPETRRLAGVRPHPARDRRRRARPVGLPGLRGVRRARAGRWRSRPRPTSSRTSSGSRSTRRSSASRGRSSWSSHRRGQGRDPRRHLRAGARPAALAGPAGAARRGDLDPRRGGRQPAADAVTADAAHRGEPRSRRLPAVDDPAGARARDGPGDRRRLAGVLARDLRLPAEPSRRRCPRLARDRDAAHARDVGRHRAATAASSR